MNQWVFHGYNDLNFPNGGMAIPQYGNSNSIYVAAFVFIFFNMHMYPLSFDYDDCHF